MRLFRAKTLSVSIACHPARAYELVFDARNLPRWSFFQSVERAGEDWILQTAEGPVQLRFVERNSLGVLDHGVTLGSGEVVYVPMRVLANGDGCEVLFTLFQTPEMSDDRFEADARQVETDLATLKTVLEAPTSF